MMWFNGAELVWNNTPVRELDICALTNSERFEFLCAISAHDPMPLGLVPPHALSGPCFQTRR